MGQKADKVPLRRSPLRTSPNLKSGPKMDCYRTSLFFTFGALFAHLHFPTITHRIIMVCSKKNRDKCKPHNTRGVHREPYVLRLVEVGGDLPVRQRFEKGFCQLMIKQK